MKGKPVVYVVTFGTEVRAVFTTPQGAGRHRQTILRRHITFPHCVRIWRVAGTKVRQLRQPR